MLILLLLFDSCFSSVSFSAQDFFISELWLTKKVKLWWEPLLGHHVVVKMSTPKVGGNDGIMSLAPPFIRPKKIRNGCIWHLLLITFLPFIFQNSETIVSAECLPFMTSQEP